MLVPTIRSVAPLFLGLVALVTGNSMLGTVAALRLEIEGFDAGVIGAVLALTSLGFVFGSILGVRIVQRVGHIRAFAAFAGAAAAAAAAHPLHVSVLSWGVLRLVLGFCVAGLMLVTESWINGRAVDRTRGALLATYMLLFFLAASGGQFAVSLGDPSRDPLFAVAAILVALATVPIALAASSPPEIGPTERLGIGTLWRRAELGVAGAAASGVVLGAFGAVGPVYAYESGLPVDEVGVFMGTAILAAMALQWPVGHLSDRLPRRLVVIAVGVAAVAAALAAAHLGGRSHRHLFAGAALLYGVSACVYPLCLALTHDMLEKSQIVPASATMLLVNGIGAVAGPILGGVAISAIGPSGFMYFLAAALSVLVVLALHSLLRERAPTVAEQSHCVGVAPVSTAAIAELDPRRPRRDEAGRAQAG